MIYKSNLTCPDLSPYFKLKTPAIQILGHDAPSDPDFEPGCTFWTHDEAAILYNVAKQVRGDWVDLGARFGWTTAHIAAAGCVVVPVDPILKFQAQQSRFESNLANLWGWVSHVRHETVQQFMEDVTQRPWDGLVIDADHDEPQPLLDAQGCHRIAKPDAVILMHDFWGRPIQDGVKWLMENGWRCRIYNTPNGVALLWRGFRECKVVHDAELSKPSNCFHAPVHVTDPAINWGDIRSRVGLSLNSNGDLRSDFPWDKTE